MSLDLPQLWRRSWGSGIHLGWEGRSWVWLQRTRAGIADAGDGPAKIRERTLRGLDRPLSPFCSHMIGPGGAALVCLGAATFDPRLRPAARQAQRRWEAACRASPLLDVTTGRAGALLACAEMETLSPGCLPPGLPRLLHGSCARRLEILLEIKEESPIHLGLTHGVAGFLLALESSRAVFGLRFAPALRDQVLEVLSSGRVKEFKRFAVWPDLNRQGKTATAWCHGAPGIALALAACWKANGRRDFLRLAEKGWLSTFLVAGKERTFCCGSTGRAQVLVEGYRLTGRRALLDWAIQVRADRGIARPETYHEKGFSRGLLGLRYLDDRLSRPADLPLPALGFLSAVSGSAKPSSSSALA